MLKKDKVLKIIEILEGYYPDPPIPLDFKDPYTLLVAVLLSAQCTDKRVNQVTPALFKRASKPEEMQYLQVEEIQSFIRTCGLSNTKAKNIRQLSEFIMTRHKGRVPDNFEELEALPGVGHKTASVVMAQAFGFPAVPIDTHIHRLMNRWGLSSGKNVVQTEKVFKKCFNKEIWNKLHLQIIFFGREYCPARGHQVDNCPICSWATSKKFR